MAKFRKEKHHSTLKIDNKKKLNDPIIREDSGEGEAHETDGTVVTCQSGVTFSENYNSIRVDVGITVPTTFKRKKKAAQRAWEFVDEELSEKLADAKKLLEDM